MSIALSQVGFAAASTLGLDGKPSERRRYQRVAVQLLGRYMLADRQEYPCQVINMSPGSVALIVPVLGIMEERVVCYLDHLGRVEGKIARLFENGFALQVTVPLSKREKLAEQLTWLANRHILGMPEDRRHDRIAPRVTRTTITTADGQTHPVKLIDVSLSGASMQCDASPPVGAPVTVGKTPARVVRVSATGIAVEFVRLLPLDQFGDAVVL